jgi:hypothetical protein
MYFPKHSRISSTKSPVILHDNIQRECNKFGDRDSPVGIETGYRLDGPGIESRKGARFFAHVQTDLGAHRGCCTVNTKSFLGVMRLGRGDNHPPPTSAKVKRV